MSVFARRVPLVPLEGWSILLSGLNNNVGNQRRSYTMYNIPDMKHTFKCLMNLKDLEIKRSALLWN